MLMRFIGYLVVVGFSGLALAAGGAYYVFASQLPKWETDDFQESGSPLAVMAMQQASRTYKEIAEALYETVPPAPGSGHAADGAASVSKTVNVPTKVFDRHGELIGQFQTERRLLVSLDRVSPTFVEAVIASEDVEFWAHHGVNFEGLARAFIQTVVFDNSQGGSSITMQLAKLMLDNLFVQREAARTGASPSDIKAQDLRPRTRSQEILKTKTEEIFFARELEQTFDKRAILLMYTNLIHFGLMNNGVESASQFYFGKPSSELLPLESVFLVGLMPNPSGFNPLEWRKYKNETDGLVRMFAVLNNEAKQVERAKARHWRALNQIASSPFFSERFFPDEASLKTAYDSFWATWTAIWSTPRENRQQKANQQRIAEPGMDYVLATVQSELSNTPFFKALFTGGMEITTTIDAAKQRAAQSVLAERVEEYREELRKRDKTRDAADKTEGALISLDSATGEIHAVVGGVAYGPSNRTSSGQLPRSHMATRQPGSSFKPFLYMAAMQERPQLHPLIFVPNNAVEVIDMPGAQDDWVVRNPGGGTLPIYLYQALKISSNTAAALYSHWLSRTDGMGRLQDMLMQSLNMSADEAAKRFPRGELAIALGAKEATPDELARLYAMIANGGRRVTSHVVARIENAWGGEIFTADYANQRPQVISPCIATMMRGMLESVVERGGTGYRVRNSYPSRLLAAGKTGTSNDSKDAWFAGFTPELTTVVWVGNDDGDPLLWGGSRAAAPIWGDYMKTILEEGAIRPENRGWTDVVSGSSCQMSRCCRCRGYDETGVCVDGNICFSIPAGVACQPASQVGLVPIYMDDFIVDDLAHYTLDEDLAGAFVNGFNTRSEANLLLPPDEMLEQLQPEIIEPDFFPENPDGTEVPMELPDDTFTPDGIFIEDGPVSPPSEAGGVDSSEPDTAIVPAPSVPPPPAELDPEDLPPPPVALPENSPDEGPQQIVPVPEPEPDDQAADESDALPNLPPPPQ